MAWLVALNIEYGGQRYEGMQQKQHAYGCHIICFHSSFYRFIYLAFWIGDIGICVTTSHVEDAHLVYLHYDHGSDQSLIRKT